MVVLGLKRLGFSHAFFIYLKSTAISSVPQRLKNATVPIFNLFSLKVYKFATNSVGNISKASPRIRLLQTHARKTIAVKFTTAVHVEGSESTMASQTWAVL
jgi:hypothetical protein